jgi:hypothetical protein
VHTNYYFTWSQAQLAVVLLSQNADLQV